MKCENQVLNVEDIEVENEIKKTISNCTSCGQIHVEVNRYGITHEATNPNHSTRISKGQRWKHKESDSRWKIQAIFTEPELKVILLPDALENPLNKRKELQPIELLNQSEWNYAGERNDFR